MRPNLVGCFSGSRRSSQARRSCSSGGQVECPTPGYVCSSVRCRPVPKDLYECSGVLPLWYLYVCHFTI